MNLREEKRIEIHFAKDKKRYQSTNDFVENAVRIGTEKKRIIFPWREEFISENAAMKNVSFGAEKAQNVNDF